MAGLIGVAMAAAICLGAAALGFSRERSFYPTMVMVIASYYVLFAVQAGAGASLEWELLAMALFVALAVAGFKTTHWFVVTALAAHGVFDFFHARLIVNAGVPPWWPLFCLTFDVAMSCILALQLVRARFAARGKA